MEERVQVDLPAAGVMLETSQPAESSNTSEADGRPPQQEPKADDGGPKGPGRDGAGHAPSARADEPTTKNSGRTA